MMFVNQLLIAFILFEYGQTNYAQQQTTTIRTRPSTTSKAFVCPFQPQCSCTSSNLVCENFDNFYELNFAKANSSALMFELIQIKPRRRQDLTEINLDLTGLGLMSRGFFELYNIDRFYFYANPFKNLKTDRNYVNLRIFNSRFEFMFDQKNSLNSKCDWSLIKDNEITRNHSLLSTAFLLELNSIEFVEPMCPFIFYNLKLSGMSVKDPSGEFKFLPTKIDKPPKNVSFYHNTYQVSALGSFIKWLKFDNISVESIDQDMINPDVFGATQSISFKNATVHKIEPNVFPNLKYLKELEMYLNNWSDLVNRTELQWMYDLNHHAPTVVDFKNLSAYSQTKFTFTMGMGTYDLSDEDYCKFVNFPHKKYVVPYLEPTPYLKCNCVIVWLLQYHADYPSLGYEFTKTSGNFTSCDSDASLMQKCTDLRNKNNCEIYDDDDEEVPEELFSIRNLTLISILATFLIIGGILLVVFVRNVRNRRAAIARHQQANQTENAAELTNFI